MRSPKRTPSRKLLLLSQLALAFAAGCSAEPTTQAETPSIALGPIVHFEFATLDDKPLTTASVAGRNTVIGFIATYDQASQAQARFLTGLYHHHTPRLNVAALVLEPPENRPMVEAFVASLKLPYPVAIADRATIAGKGPFQGLHHVPSVVVLDAAGREVWRHVGLVEGDELERAILAVEAAQR
jgi:hypothetical protein